MFALTIKQPHAFHILHSGKDVENRTWKLPEHHKNQWIALHAAKTADKTVPAVNGIDSSYYGAIIGFLKFSDCVQVLIPFGREAPPPLRGSPDNTTG